MSRVVQRWLLSSFVVVLLGAVAVAQAPPLRETLDRADKLFSQKDFSAAEKEYRRATEIDPGSIPAWRGLGWSLWQTGQRKQAIQVWKDILQIVPQEASIHLALAQAYEQNKEWNASLEAYAKVLELQPDHKGAVAARARIHRYLGDVKAKSGSTSAAIAEYERSLRSRPGHRGTVRGLADLYMAEKRWDDARRILERHLAAHPDDDELRLRLARVEGFAGNTASAERQWRALLERNPGRADWAMQLARILQEQGRTDDAVEVAKEVLARDPQNRTVLDFLADQAVFAGREEEAMAWLERIVAEAPTARRLSQLGNLHVARGRRLAEAGDESAARAEYRTAATAFGRARELDPKDHDARLGEITALRLHGEVRRAVELAEALHAEYPNLEPVNQALYEGYLELEDFARAEEFLARLEKQFPGSIRWRRDAAYVLFQKGEESRAISELEGMLAERLRPNVPVLLYRGVSAAAGAGATPVENLRSNLETLKREGYESITVERLVAWLDGKGDLPPKPVMITFDDGRTDSFRNADPVLREVGYRAVMFLPAAEMARQIPFYADWGLVRQMAKSGRWEMQCSGYVGQRRIPVDAQSTKGRFLANRQWLDSGRLETEEEFQRRVDEDMRRCRQEVEKNVPSAKVRAFAYPSDDLGQRTLSNHPGAFVQNQELAARNFAAAFTIDSPGFVVADMPRTLLPRFEVPRTMTGDELLDHLERREPRRAVLSALADLYGYAGRYDEALATYAMLESEGMDPAAISVARAKLLTWRGDYASAKDILDRAAVEQPGDPEISRRLAALEFYFRPTLRGQGSYYEDDRERSVARGGVSGRAYLTNRLSIAPSYEHLRMEHDQFEIADLEIPGPPDPNAPPGTPPPFLGGESRLRANGHQFQTELLYQWGPRTSFGVGGGFAEFEDDSDTDLVDDPDTFEIVTGVLNFGLGDDLDVSVRGTRDYVPTAGAVLQGVKATGSTTRVRWRPADLIELFGQHAYDNYEERDNHRNTLLGQVLFNLLDSPRLRLGYQFVYDDAKDDDPLFYTPNEFRAHEAVANVQIRPTKFWIVNIAGSAGVGQEEDTDPEAQGSFSGTTELTFTENFGVFASGARSQAANFSSFTIGGGVFLRF